MPGIRIKNTTSPDAVSDPSSRPALAATLAAAAETSTAVESVIKSNAGRPAGLLTQGSATETVSKMEVGDTVALCRRLDGGSKPEIEKLYAGMSATLQSAGRRASENPAAVEGFEYKIERGQWKTKDGSTMLVVALTRMSG